MVIIGIKDSVVDICVSITPDQLNNVQEMYPDHQIMEQVGNENIGWAYNGSTFTEPV